jgi:hypothetical protein
MYEGNSELRMKVFDDAMCCMHYHDISERNGDDTDNE